MYSQQLHDLIIKPTLEYMGEHYNSESARFLLLATAAVESNCGEYIKQVKGPSLGIWQIDPHIERELWLDCPPLQDDNFVFAIKRLQIPAILKRSKRMVVSPCYAAAIARLIYYMAHERMPTLTGCTQVDSGAFYRYYRKHYCSDPIRREQWDVALYSNGIFKVEL